MKSAESEGLLQPVKKRHYSWSTAEVRVIREVYPVKGADACLALLPGRTRSGVHQQAGRLGIRAPAQPQGKRKRWISTPELDAQIRSGYAAATGRRAIVEMAERLDRPAWWISRRALDLGIVAPRFRDLPWSAEEIAKLQSLATLTPQVIARNMRAAGYNRSATACKVKMTRLQLDREDPDQWSANALAKLMGVDSHTVKRWIEREGLPASRAGTARVAAQGGDERRIKRAALRSWIRTHAQLVDLRKVDRFWFIELVLGAA